MWARDDETCVLCRRTGVRFWGPEDEFCRWCEGMKETIMKEFREQREHHWFETLTPMEKNQLLCDFAAFKRRPFGFADWRQAYESVGETEAPARPPPTKRLRSEPLADVHPAAEG